MRIKRTKKIDRRGMTRVGRKFGIAPMFLDQLRTGKVVELPDDKAEQLISRGYAINAGGRASVDNMTVDDKLVTSLENVNAPEIDEEDEDFDELDDDERDIKL